MNDRINYKKDDDKNENESIFSKWMREIWSFWQQRKGLLILGGAFHMFKRMIYDHFLPITEVRNLIKEGSI